LNVYGSICRFVDSLLHDERVCDIPLPRMPTQYPLEETDKLELRVGLLRSETDSDEDGNVEESDGDDE
jgi:pre-mRNA-splicing factor 38A